MIKRRYWHSMPSDTIRAVLPLLTWQRVDGLSPASGTASLMLLVALRFMADKQLDQAGRATWLADASYDELGEATGLSRSMISQGLKRLQMLKLITSEGSSQKRRYRLSWSTGGWFKLPCQDIVSDDEIKPFTAFTMRSKDELHAMKLYLYLAAARDNNSPYSMSAYETIWRHTNIPERHIPKAINVLNASGLLARVVRDNDAGEGIHGPNKYFLTGHRGLFMGLQESAAAATATAADYAEHLA